MSRRIFAGLTGLALAGLLAGSALAYTGVITAINLSAPSTAVSGEEFDLSVSLQGEGLEVAAGPIEGETVTWGFEVAEGDADVELGAETTETDATGTATNTATIVCSGCTVVFTASVEDANGTASDTAEVEVKAAGLPNTSTNTGFSTGFFATLLAIFAVIAGAGLMVRQVVVTRR